MLKGFIVTAKCGHVGKNKYILMDFAIHAENAKKAAAIARSRPAVKRHRSDAIVCVREVEKEEYYSVRKASRNDLYWHKTHGGIRSKQALFHARIVHENEDLPGKTNKADTRKFRRRRAHFAERSFCRDVAEEYGISV